MNPYVQASLFVSECINLDLILNNGLIKLVEKSGSYKDRYSCISYLNWVVSHLDKELLKETEESDDWEVLQKVCLFL
jgi:hypothetical protein